VKGRGRQQPSIALGLPVAHLFPSETRSQLPSCTAPHLQLNVCFSCGAKICSWPHAFRAAAAPAARAPAWRPRRRPAQIYPRCPRPRARISKAPRAMSPFRQAPAWIAPGPDGWQFLGAHLNQSTPEHDQIDGESGPPIPAVRSSGAPPSCAHAAARPGPALPAASLQRACPKKRPPEKLLSSPAGLAVVRRGGCRSGRPVQEAAPGLASPSATVLVGMLCRPCLWSATPLSNPTKYLRRLSSHGFFFTCKAAVGGGALRSNGHGALGREGVVRVRRIIRRVRGAGDIRSPGHFEGCTAVAGQRDAGA
jgi:hypothetical protein